MSATNPCAKARKKQAPYEVWYHARSGFEWRVLKKYQTPTGEAANPHARWFCFVTSPGCPDGEYGDVYVRDITGCGAEKVQVTY